MYKKQGGNPITIPKLKKIKKKGFDDYHSAKRKASRATSLYSAAKGYQNDINTIVKRKRDKQGPKGNLHFEKGTPEYAEIKSYVANRNMLTKLAKKKEGRAMELTDSANAHFSTHKTGSEIYAKVDGGIRKGAKSLKDSLTRKGPKIPMRY